MLSLKSELEPGQSFAALRRQFIYAWLADQGLSNVNELQELMQELTRSTPRLRSLQEQVAVASDFSAHKAKQEKYSIEKTGGINKEAYYVGAKRIERIELWNFKAIESLTLNFATPKAANESWMMLIGENGTGKSAILQAVALTLMGQRHNDSLELDASRFVRRNAKEGKGHVRVDLTGLDKPIEMKFDKKSKRFQVNPPDPKILLLGYGATRLLPRNGSGADRRKNIRIQNLFDPFAPLNNAEKWLGNKRQVSEQRFHQISLALKDLLMLEEESVFTRKNRKVQANLYGVRLDLQDLSDGYQSVLAMVIDIIIGISDKWTNIQHSEGIVLIDELEVHLHPRWKMQIVESLRRTFPKMAFLVTTHDPLCLKGLQQEEIVLLQRDENDRISAMTSPFDVEDMRADQILTSDLFGLRTTRSKLAEKSRRYTELYLKTTRSPAEEQEFQTLQTDLREKFSWAETPGGRWMEQALQAAMQSLPQPGGPSPLPDAMKMEIREQLQRLLQKK